MRSGDKKRIFKFCTLPKFENSFFVALFRCLLYATLALSPPIDFPHSGLASNFVHRNVFLPEKSNHRLCLSGGLPFRWTNCLISQVCPVVLSLPGRQATMHSRVPNSLAILWYTTVRFPVPTTVPGLVGTPGTHFLYQLLSRVHLVPQEHLSCTKR